MLDAYLGMSQLLSMLNRDHDALGCLNEALQRFTPQTTSNQFSVGFGAS